MDSTDIFVAPQSCSGHTGDNLSLCLAIEAEVRNRVALRDFGLVFSAALVFIMQCGFALVNASAVTYRNIANTVAKNMLDACIGAAVGFYTIGYGFAFGSTGHNEPTFVGTSNFFTHGVDDLAFWFFEFTFCAASATIVAGAIAERCQIRGYFVYATAVTIFVYPIVAHAVWSTNGFLSPFITEPLLGVGMVDFAGSGVVHVVGGTIALVAVIILGPRQVIAEGMNDIDDTLRSRIRVHRAPMVSLQMMGTFILWFGWYGFNAGSTFTYEVENAGEIVALAAVNTTLAAAASGLFAFLFMIFLSRLNSEDNEVSYELVALCNGVLSGLVAITAGCGVVDPWASLFIGVVAGGLYLLAAWGLRRWEIDDAVDAVPVHLSNGIWGVIAVGLFAEPERLKAIIGSDEHVGWFYSLSRGSFDAKLLACQLIGLIFIIAWVGVIMCALFFALEWGQSFKVSDVAGKIGIDSLFASGLESRLCREDIELMYGKSGENTARRAGSPIPT